jgi:hypothetical protein
MALPKRMTTVAPCLAAMFASSMERASQVTPLKTYLDAGFLVVGGTDSPVVPFNPFFELYHFLTRETITGGVYGANERVASRVDLLRMITINHAKLTGENRHQGLDRARQARRLRGAFGRPADRRGEQDPADEGRDDLYGRQTSLSRSGCGVAVERRASADRATESSYTLSDRRSVTRLD